MPYNSVSDLPERIRSKYSPKAQRAFMHAFNSAYDGLCQGREDREGCAFAVGTAAAKKTEKSAVSKFIDLLKGLASELETEETVEKAIDTEGGTTEKTSKSETVSIAKASHVVKADDELQVLYSPVLAPNEIDSQDDITEPEEIRIAAYRFAKEYAAGEAELGLDHKTTLTREQAHIVEYWLEKQDVDYGTDVIPKGTWMLGVHIPDKEIWESAKSGERTGLSIEGTGERTPL